LRDRLRVLHLGGFTFTKAGVETLAQFQQLKQLHLGRVAVSADTDLDGLKKLLPNCEIR
jgi:hypothetical protein